jgi:hypothetical protein
MASAGHSSMGTPVLLRLWLVGWSTYLLATQQGVQSKSLEGKQPGRLTAQHFIKILCLSYTAPE